VPIREEIDPRGHLLTRTSRHLGGSSHTGGMNTISALEGPLAALIDAKWTHLRASMHASTMCRVIPALKQVAQHQSRTRGSHTCLGGAQPKPLLQTDTRAFWVVSKLNRLQMHSFKSQHACQHHVKGDSGAKTGGTAPTSDQGVTYLPWRGPADTYAADTHSILLGR
jgi:hypothetical protein